MGGTEVSQSLQTGLRKLRLAERQELLPRHSAEVTAVHTLPNPGYHHNINRFALLLPFRISVLASATPPVTQQLIKIEFIPHPDHLPSHPQDAAFPPFPPGCRRRRCHGRRARHRRHSPGG